MKPLELSQQQKDKLLEIAKHYFPEYRTRMVYLALGLFKKGEKVQYIHWFEFCLTWLADKIIYQLDRQTNGTGLVKEEEMAYMLYSKLHPVDYLYEKYQKVKH